jgi:hypothetical protein
LALGQNCRTPKKKLEIASISKAIFITRHKSVDDFAKKPAFLFPPQIVKSNAARILTLPSSPSSFF